MNYKKLSYAILLSALSLNAASSQYVGVTLSSGYSWIKQMPTNQPSTNIDPYIYGAKFNVGVDSGEDLRTNIFFGLDYFDQDLYEAGTSIDPNVGSSNQLLYSVGFDIIKTYSEKGSSTLPYLKGGMDYEFMSLDGYAQSWASNVGLTFGAGTFLRMSETTEFQLGMVYKYRMWGNYNLDTPDTQNVELSDHSLMLELGLNFHY
ncbi:MAG: hypothetical protein PF439_07500 [Helicobacteraceae bacterium]|jgi:hypothetical protein|nr:hypothetical protein [Helicobacteraceae bacterium]